MDSSSNEFGRGGHAAYAGLTEKDIGERRVVVCARSCALFAEVYSGFGRTGVTRRSQS